MSDLSAAVEDPREDLETFGKLQPYVTVFAAPLWHGPRQRAVLEFLKAEGYDVRPAHHFIQVRVDTDDFDRVDSVAKMIHNFTFKEDDDD